MDNQIRAGGVEQRGTSALIFSREFLKAYIITMRPYLMFVSGITGLAGMSFIPKLSLVNFSLLFSASFLSYGFGQALTDCFQIDTDSISSPYRPLTQGRITRVQTFTASIVGLMYCITVFGSQNRWNLLLGVIAGLGLGTYTYFKRRWWGGPFYNAWIVAVLCSMGYLSGGDISNIFETQFPKLLASVLFGYANFVLSGYFKDIEADRATGYQTLPVIFGRKFSSCISDIFACVAVLFAFLTFVRLPDSGHTLVSKFIPYLFLGSAIGCSLLAQIRLHTITTDQEAHYAISPAVHSYILLLSSIITIQKPEWILFIVIYYAAFNVTLVLRPAQNQI